MRVLVTSIILLSLFNFGCGTRDAVLKSKPDVIEDVKPSAPEPKDREIFIKIKNVKSYIVYDCNDSMVLEPIFGS